MPGQVIAVPQADGEIVVTFPGVRRVPLAVVDGAVTVHDDELAEAVLATVDGAALLDEDAPEFDPDEHTVAEVNEYLTRHPGDTTRVLDAEADGRARVGILAAHTPPAEADDEAG